MEEEKDRTEKADEEEWIVLTKKKSPRCNKRNKNINDSSNSLNKSTDMNREDEESHNKDKKPMGAQSKRQQNTTASTMDQETNINSTDQRENNLTENTKTLITQEQTIPSAATYVDTGSWRFKSNI